MQVSVETGEGLERKANRSGACRNRRDGSK